MFKYILVYHVYWTTYDSHSISIPLLISKLSSTEVFFSTFQNIQQRWFPPLVIFINHFLIAIVKQLLNVQREKGTPMNFETG